MNKILPETEREVKVLGVQVSTLMKRLDELGANKRYATKMRVVSYDFVGSSLHPYVDTITEDTSIASGINEVLSKAFEYYTERGPLKENNAHLRLRYREDDEMAELCFKYNTHAQSKHKVAFEYNFNLPVAAARRFERTAADVGLVQVALHEKKRVSYRLNQNGCVCDIDTYPGIPTYVEVEHGDERVISATIGMLQLGTHKQSIMSGQDFFQMYNVNYYSKLTF